MGAPDADQRSARDGDERVKAAAWAWYQRGGGSMAAGAGRSEAFATRCNCSLLPSRFQREASLKSRHRPSLASDATLFSSSSSMDNLLGSSSSISCSTTFPGDTATDGSEEPIDVLLPADQHGADESSDGHASLALVSMDPAAFWDCGSSLFDSFELVAMSKKLDAELHEPNIDGQLADGAHPLASLFGDHEPKLLLCDAPFSDMSPPSSPPSISPPSSADNEKSRDVFEKLLAASDRQSKQAVYDMFCRYADAEAPAAKQSSKRSPPSADTICGGEARKHKAKQGRLSFQALAKALYNIRRLHSHTTSGGGRDGDGDESSHDEHHHHHLHFRPSPQISASGKPTFSPGQGGSMRLTMPMGEPYAGEDMIEVPKAKSSHVHHHHHHHYHYLFHSDEDYRFQPPDKSLMVAAAGLRTLKSIPSLSSYLDAPARADAPVDLSGKLGEFGCVPSPAFQY